MFRSLLTNLPIRLNYLTSFLGIQFLLTFYPFSFFYILTRAKEGRPWGPRPQKKKHGARVFWPHFAKNLTLDPFFDFEWLSKSNKILYRFQHAIFSIFLRFWLHFTLFFRSIWHHFATFFHAFFRLSFLHRFFYHFSMIFKPLES